MKLYTYKNQLVKFFNEFNKVNISFTEIKAKLSTAGIEVKDSEEKGALFDTMQRNSDQLKDAIATLDSLLKEDEKNKTNANIINVVIFSIFPIKNSLPTL